MALARGRFRVPAFHESLIVWVVVAAGLGVALPDVASALKVAVPVMLAGQVAGVALSIPADELKAVSRIRNPILVAGAVQWILMPAAGYGIYRLAGRDLSGQGALITSASPAEITSALLAVLAGADAATGAAAMTLSVTAGCVLTPLLVGHLLDSAGRIDQTGLITELALSVALPMIIGVALRTKVPALVRHERRCFDLAGISLVAVVFVGAGQARPVIVSSRIVEMTALAGALVAAGILTAALAGWSAIGASSVQRRALAFPAGMREFGIATAVAISVSPRAAGFAGLYGIVMMAASVAAAGRLRRRPASR